MPDPVAPKVSILIQTTKFSTKKAKKGAKVPDPIAPRLMLLSVRLTKPDKVEIGHEGQVSSSVVLSLVHLLSIKERGEMLVSARRSNILQGKTIGRLFHFRKSRLHVYVSTTCQADY